MQLVSCRMYPEIDLAASGSKAIYPPLQVVIWLFPSCIFISHTLRHRFNMLV